MRIDDTTALLVIDVQNDFCPGGSLAVPDGDRVVPPLNDAVQRFNGHMIVASRDWHPAVTSHFKAWGGLWPPHCVRQTSGAEFHPDLRLPNAVPIVSKGVEANVDSYSAFEGTLPDGRSLTDLLHEHHIRTLVVGGLATDYCVKNSVLDALKNGFEVYVLEEAVRGVEVAPGDTQRALADMRSAGAHLTTVAALA